MPATNHPAYPEHLHEAIDAARGQLFTQATAAAADMESAHGALTVARRTCKESFIDLLDAEAADRVAAYVDRMMVNASLLAASCVTHATKASEHATTAAAAANTATLSIKSAADSVEAVTKSISGISGMVRNDDAAKPVAERKPGKKNEDDDEETTTVKERSDPSQVSAHEAAADAAARVRKVGNAMLELKKRVLLANVDAAAPRAPSALDAATACQTSIAEILAGADAAVAAVTARRTAANTAFRTAWQAVRSRQAEFEIAGGNDTSLADALAQVDAIANHSLQAWPANKTKDGQEEAGIGASITLPAALARKTEKLRVFAVPESHAASFTFESAYAVDEESSMKIATPSGDKGPGAKDGVTYELELLTRDFEGTKIAFGSSYRVFALRIPKAGKPTVADFSYGTRSVIAAATLEFPDGPEAWTFADFKPPIVVAGFRSVAPADAVDCYRLFVCDEAAADFPAEKIRGGRLGLAHFTNFEAGEAVRSSDQAVKALVRMLKRAAADSDQELSDSDHRIEAIKTWLGKHASGEPKSARAYLAYLSSAQRTIGWQEDSGIVFDELRNHKGSVPDLHKPGHQVRVFAVGKRSRPPGPTAGNTLSEGSEDLTDARRETRGKKAAGAKTQSNS